MSCEDESVQCKYRDLQLFILNCNFFDWEKVGWAQNSQKMANAEKSRTGTINRQEKNIVIGNFDLFYTSVPGCYLLENDVRLILRSIVNIDSRKLFDVIKKAYKSTLLILILYIG